MNNHVLEDFENIRLENFNDLIFKDLLTLETQTI